MNKIQNILEQSNIQKYEDNEFENLINLFNLYDNNRNINYNIKYLTNQYKNLDLYYRKILLSEYYNLPISDLDIIQTYSQDKRRIACNEKGIIGYFFRTLIDYNRYSQCFFIFKYLYDNIKDFNNLNLLDFGCMVSDYGYFFGKLGCNITICDIKNHVDFAEWRLNRSFIKNVKIYAPTNYNDITKNKDIAIFSEILEHLYDPYDLLKSCVDNNVKYIYSTKYPDGDDNYFALNGHRKEAQNQAESCKKLLNDNYFFNNKLWILR